MVDGDDPGDATQHGVTDVMKGVPKDEGATVGRALPTYGGDTERYTWEPERDQFYAGRNPGPLKYTGWKFPVYDRALGRVVAVCSEQYMAARLCKKLNEHEHGG